MNLLDVAIVTAAALGTLTGWRSGFIGPVLAQAGALAGAAALYFNPDILARLLPAGAVRPLVGVGLVVLLGAVLGSLGSEVAALAHRVGVLRKADQVVGVALGGVIALVTTYVVLLGTVTVDGLLAPLHDAGTLRPTEVAALRALVEAHPQTRVFVDAAALERLEQAAAQAPVSLRDLGEFDGVLAFFELELRPQLATSRLAPLVLALGENLPVIGRPAGLPRP